MSSEIVNTHRYPFEFADPIKLEENDSSGVLRNVTFHIPNVRGKVPSIQASRLRTMLLESHRDPSKIAAYVCTYDGLTSRLAEEAGFPLVFLAGYAVASSYGYVRPTFTYFPSIRNYSYILPYWLSKLTVVPGYLTPDILRCKRSATRFKKPFAKCPFLFLQMGTRDTARP